MKRLSGPCGGVIVSGDRVVHVTVIVIRKIARNGSGLEIDSPEIELRVRSRWIGDEAAMERQLLSVRTYREMESSYRNGCDF